jgi:thiamine-phosphate pyrophosphorylase
MILSRLARRQSVMLATSACQTWTVYDRRQRLSASRLYLVCDARPDAFLDAVVKGGVDIVQLRVKQGSDAEILAAAARFKRVCEEHGALFLLNDSPELAVEADADGVHLGQEDMPVAGAREIVGAERLVGLSTHTPEQVLRAAGADGPHALRAAGADGPRLLRAAGAARAGADYIGVGPVHETPTKPGRPAVGLELVRFAAANARMPFFAIGGIDVNNIDRVRDAGATRVAVVRALTDARDPEQTARALRRALQAGAHVGAA